MYTWLTEVDMIKTEVSDEKNWLSMDNLLNQL